MIISLITVKNLTLAYGDKNIVDDLAFLWRLAIFWS